jgi:hypothetical protein
MQWSGKKVSVSDCAQLRYLVEAVQLGKKVQKLNFSSTWSFVWVKNSYDGILVTKGWLNVSVLIGGFQQAQMFPGNF